MAKHWNIKWIIKSSVFIACHMMQGAESTNPFMQAVVGCSEVAVRLVAHHGATQLSVYYGPQLCAQGKREGGGVGQRGGVGEGGTEGRGERTGDSWGCLV